MTSFISRRTLLKRALGASVAVPIVGRLERSLSAAQAPAVQAMPAAPESLSSHELEILNAVASRLIPNDANGPGAVDAGATRYIDRALAGPLSSSRQAYTHGLAALDQYAESSRGKPFRELSPTDQDSVLIDVETGAASGFTGGSAPFFAMLVGHTHQGMFGDPYYGGNKDFAGWDLVRYPGVRTMVTVADQHGLETGQLKPNHRSAYDYGTFTKADPQHGD